MLNFTRLQEIFKGNGEAVEFCRLIVELIHTWDDLIDQDKPVQAKEINRAFWIALIEIPANLFFRRHEAVLQPLIANSIINWHASVQLEHGTDRHGFEIAHILRYWGAGIFVQVALIAGGPEHAERCAAEIWLMIKEESLDDYIKEMTRHAEYPVL